MATAYVVTDRAMSSDIDRVQARRNRRSFRRTLAGAATVKDTSGSITARLRLNGYLDTIKRVQRICTDCGNAEGSQFPAKSLDQSGASTADNLNKGDIPIVPPRYDRDRTLRPSFVAISAAAS